jgi:hypothetical protein
VLGARKCYSMAKSKAAEELDHLQSQLRPFLKEHGFRIRARTSNRQTSDGLTHVINFQMGRFDPPGTSYIPWFRKNLYGVFTVNVGVYVPEVATAQLGIQPRSFVQEVDCCMRERLGMLGPEHSDRWWDLPSNRDTAADLEQRLERDALSLPERFESRDSVLDELGRAEEISGIGGPPRIICAIMLAHRGQIGRARDLLAAQIRLSASPKHSEYVQALADRLGLGRIDP